MKKRHPLLLTLLVLLLLLGIPTGLLVREYRQETLNHMLVAAVKANNTEAALKCLKAGANANVNILEDKPVRFRDSLNHLIDRLLRRHTRSGARQTLLALLYEMRTPDRFNSANIIPPENSRIVAALLEQGADPNVRDRYGSTPLVEAASWGYTESVRLLLQYGAEVDARGGYNNRTALHSTIFPNAIRLLIAHGADVNARTEKGETPLMTAYCQPRKVQVLLDAHANVNLQDNEGYTALDYNQGEYQNLLQRPAFYNWLTPPQFQKLIERTREVEKILRKAGAKSGQELSSPH